MGVSGILPVPTASYGAIGGGAGASVNGAVGAAGQSSVGPAAVLTLSGGASPLPAIESISVILAAELHGSTDLAA